MHVSRQSEAAHESERPKAVDHVVDIKSVPRTLALPHSRECAVERVAQPVEREAGNDGEQGIAIPGRESVAYARADLRGQA